MRWSMTLFVEIIPCLTDNYAVLLHETNTGETTCIDAPDHAPINIVLEKKKWKLTDLFITHHHDDHVDGLKELKRLHKCNVYGPKFERDKIDGLDNLLEDGDKLSWAGHSVKIIETPGHTLGHICFYFAEEELLFSADTLFLAGCGRLFEGTHKAMFESLGKLLNLPSSTKVFCGHEYTLSNIEFAEKFEPNNIDLHRRAIATRKLREANIPTLPSTLGDELKTNPFLRTASKEIRSNLGLDTASDLEVFTRLRELRDDF